MTATRDYRESADIAAHKAWAILAGMEALAKMTEEQPRFVTDRRYSKAADAVATTAQRRMQLVGRAWFQSNQSFTLHAATGFMVANTAITPTPITLTLTPIALLAAAIKDASRAMGRQGKSARVLAKLATEIQTEGNRRGRRRRGFLFPGKRNEYAFEYTADWLRRDQQAFAEIVAGESRFAAAIRKQSAKLGSVPISARPYVAFLLAYRTNRIPLIGDDLKPVKLPSATIAPREDVKPSRDAVNAAYTHLVYARALYALGSVTTYDGRDLWDLHLGYQLQGPAKAPYCRSPRRPYEFKINAGVALRRSTARLSVRAFTMREILRRIDTQATELLSQAAATAGAVLPTLDMVATLDPLVLKTMRAELGAPAKFYKSQFSAVSDQHPEWITDHHYRDEDATALYLLVSGAQHDLQPPPDLNSAELALGRTIAFEPGAAV